MRSFLAIILAVLPVFQYIYSSPDQVWEELAPMPEGRSGMIAFITEEKEPAYYGGSSWMNNRKRIHASGYTLKNGKWHSLNSLKNPIAYAAIAGREGLLYAVGGTDGIDLRPNILALNSNLQKTKIEIIPEQARIYAGAAFIDNAFYQIGGSTKLSPLNPSAAISKFEEGSWNDFGRLPEGPLINPTVATWKGSILVMGGGVPNADGLKNTDSVFSFETTERTWTKRANLPAPTRGAVAVSVPLIGVLVIGGYLDPPESTSKVMLFDSEKNEFISLVNLPTGLMLPAVVATGNWIYVFGGEDAPRHRSQRVFRAALSSLLKSRIE